MFTLRLLGGASLDGPDGPVAGRAALRQRVALLALLAVEHPRPLSRDSLLASLWSENGTDEARHLLRDSLYILRSALGDDSVRIGRAESPLGAADLMRQLVYLPQASIVVAEAQRAVVGGAILALRPSVVAGGYVGTIDFLVIDPEHDAERITAALLEELLRSASNKGCTVVEADRPDDEVLDRWQRMGFTEAGPRIQRTVAAAGSAARRQS